MKRLISILLIFVMLTACGAQVETAKEEKGLPAGEMTLPENTHVENDTGECACTMTTEWEEYDPSVGSVWYILKNESSQAVSLGWPYSLETLGENSTWYQVPLVKDAAWTAMAYGIPAGESIAMACSFSMFDYDFSGGGTYRIVKEVEGQTCTAEFRLKKGAAISADTPYGFVPVEDLPETYGADSAAEADVVYTNDGVKNDGAVETFLDKVGLGIPCQLRTVQDYGEGAVMVIDAIYKNGCFLWRMRQGDYVAEERFSYIVTDRTDLYLSNGADWETAERYANKELVWLVPMGTAGPELVSAVEKLTEDRLATNRARYRVWSADGQWEAFLTEVPTEFFVSEHSGGGGRGSMYNLNQWDGLETVIWGLEWQEDGKLLLVCETVDGGASRLTFDPETETLENGTGN
ncbi:immunoglobulin-like domain-containing protein [Dysosmobacter sp.]|uniref:immunoglobulin-like domain-containing protein n=1 Tax=Dysosmobacter sp. TaxID=2591382 RepID=UPI002A9D8C58|nr:immunoglobulin-like domain-containing protein [Dysosmobacter sp.]MDY5612849.1 immunoglobulin-like domain-containing protein [Dysosmobacter sp.]